MSCWPGLCGAIVWNIITWFFGLPTSSSHALIGGLAGSGLMASHLHRHTMAGVLNWGAIDRIAMFIVLAPMIGMVLGFGNMVVVMWIFRNAAPRKNRHVVPSGCSCSPPAAYSLGHGTNDAQKTMGVISILLIAAGTCRWVPAGRYPVPWEVKTVCALAIAVGNDVRRMADSQDHGPWHHQTQASRRVLCRNCGSYHDSRRVDGGDSGQHDAYYHRRDSRRRARPVASPP